MHDLQTVVTDDHSVCQSVCHIAQLSFTAKMAGRIKILFGMNTSGGPRNIVLDGDPWLPQRVGGSWRKFHQLWTHYISQDGLRLET